MPRLANKIALITGGGDGFGEAMAKAFAAEGARVALIDLHLPKAERVAREIGPQAIALQADVSDGAAIRAALAQTVAAFGVPHIIVNNAGYTHRNQPLLNVDEASFDRCFAVNVKAIYHMVQAAVPMLRDNGGGSMINIGSVAGIRPRPGLTWYNASKGAANLLTKSLAVELAPLNIRVNVICPVMAATGMLEDFMGLPDTPENRAKFIASVPMGRLAEAQDIVGAAVFLASDEAAFVTGVELPVDGGRVV